MPIELTSNIIPKNSGSFPTHDALYGRGGRREVDNISDRDSIPASRRTSGMQVYVRADQKTYILQTNLSSWIEDPLYTRLLAAENSISSLNIPALSKVSSTAAYSRVILPTTVDFAAEFTQAVEDTQAGGTIELVPFATYTALSSLNFLDKNIKFRGNGATIIRDPSVGTVPFLTATYSNSAVQSVIGLPTIVNISLAPGEPGLTTPVTRIEVSSVAGVVVGDTVKIFSSDIIPHGSRNSDGSLRNEVYGECFIVAKVENGANKYIYSFTPLRTNPQTNIRISKLNTLSKIFNFSDVTLADPYNDVIPNRALGNQFVLVVNPVRASFDNIKLNYTIGGALQINGGHLSTFSRIKQYKGATDFSQGEGDLVKGQFAYTVALYGCTDTTVTESFSSDVRHLVTTGALDGSTFDQVTSTEIARYGGIVGLFVSNCSALNCQNAAIDTHEEAIDVTISNCHVTMPYQGPTAAPFCYQIRGKDCKILACSGTGERGISMYSVGTGGGNHVVEGYVHTRPAGYGRNAAIIKMQAVYNGSNPQPKMSLEATIRGDRVYGVLEVDNVEANIILHSPNISFWSGGESFIADINSNNQLTNIIGTPVVGQTVGLPTSRVPSGTTILSVSGNTATMSASALQTLTGLSVTTTTADFLKNQLVLQSNASKVNLAVLGDFDISRSSLATVSPNYTTQGTAFIFRHEDATGCVSYMRTPIQIKTGAVQWAMGAGGTLSAGIIRIGTIWSATAPSQGPTTGGFYQMAAGAELRSRLNLLTESSSQVTRSKLNPTYTSTGTISITYPVNVEETLFFYPFVNIAGGKGITIDSAPSYEGHELILEPQSRSIGTLTLVSSVNCPLTASIVLSSTQTLVLRGRYDVNNVLVWKPNLTPAS